MNRTYLTFGSIDGNNWALLDPVEAGGPDQALNLARDQRPFEHYAVVPKRNWAARTPSVKERAPVVTWAPLDDGQITIEDVLKDGDDQIEKERVIDEAKEALAKKPASPSEAARHTVLDTEAL